MKKILFAGLLAVSLAGLSQDRASAWFKFGLGGSFNTGLAWGGQNFELRSQGCDAPCCPMPYGCPSVKPTGGMPKAQAAAPAMGYPAPSYQSVGYEHAVPAIFAVPAIDRDE